MVDNANRTFVSSVLFLDIVGYSKQSVTDQLALKQRFNDLLVDALKHVAVSDRIVLDTGDGAAVSFQGNPEDSLFAAMHLRDALAASADEVPTLDVRFGINLGPVRLIKDINGQINIIGDGINAAQRVMSFAEAGVILVSRSYFEVVSRLSDDYAKIFHDAGTRTDKHVREHAVYSIGKPTDSAAPETIAAGAESQMPATDSATDLAAPAQPEASATARPNRRKLAVGIVAAIVILAVMIGIGSRSGTKEKAPEPVAKAAPAPVIAEKNAPSPAAIPKTPPAKEAPKPVASATTAHIPKLAVTPSPPLANSNVVLAISPWGEVYLDGKKKGVSPPLKVLSLTPGAHTIEVRNPGFPALVKSVVAKPGNEIRVQHKF